MITTRTVGPGVHALTREAQIPGLGSIPINAFVLEGEAPLLVDTGAVVDRDEFVAALGDVIDPHSLRYIWLTHTDFDHIGALTALVSLCPQLQVVTTFMSAGIMGLADPLPLDRVVLVNPGETAQLGDRTITAVKPPVFDNACTTGFFDHASGTLFSSDCFGALLSSLPDNAADLSDAELRQGQVQWATIDSPWVHTVDAHAYAASLERFRAIEPTTVLSSHLAPAPGAMFGRMIGSLAAVPGADVFVGPDQAALELMLAGAPAA